MFDKKSILLSFAACLLLSACGGGEPSNQNSEAKTSSNEVKSSAEQTATETASVSESSKPDVTAKAELTSEEAMLKRGKIVWLKCRSCHETDPGARHKVGPNLNGLMGAQAGVKDGFVFSPAMVDSGIVWDDETLDAFLEKPAQYVKGTKMAFVGVRKESDRQALIAYIKEITATTE